jgi:predicted ATPase
MRAHATAFLNIVDATPDSPAAGVAHRLLGTTHWFAGEYREARDQLECALAVFKSGRDDDLAFHFGHDAGVAAMLLLAIVLWPLGDVQRAVSTVSSAETRLASLEHVGARAFGRLHAAMFELMRGDRSRLASSAIELARTAQEHELQLFHAWGVFLEGWVIAASQASASSGLGAMRRGIELLRGQNVVAYDGLVGIRLAEAETRAGDVDRALAILDEALATCERTGHRAFEAELHRTRGEMLLKHNPANPAPAEEAFEAAIAVAKRQGTRSFELRAALALAKLYQSTSRSVEAHAVLAPALEGFSPTPEMPEIAEAQALLAALAESEEVKTSIAQRVRRLDLQASYGRALQLGKGFAAEETEAAFARVAEFARPNENPAARFAGYDAQCLGSLIRGEFSVAQEIAETFLREAEVDGHATEAGTARLNLGVVLFYRAT